jgi:hypothetical protein
MAYSSNLAAEARAIPGAVATAAIALEAGLGRGSAPPASEAHSTPGAGT